VRFAFIHAEKAHYPVAMLCKALGVARSGLYASAKRPESKRARENRGLLVHIRDAHFVAGQRAYGSPRVFFELKDRGFRVGRNRIARLMRLDGIKARVKRRFVATTVTDPGLPVARNVLDRKFSPKAPNQAWAADITYVRTLQGWLYLAVVLDLYSRRIVGWAVRSTLETELVAAAWQMAVTRRNPEPGLIHHSDRGSQYTSDGYQALLRRYGVRVSMSRAGNCFDNAPTESFFRTLKVEIDEARVWPTRASATEAIADFIDGFYNTQRLHSRLGYRTPAEFEASRAAA